MDATTILTTVKIIEIISKDHPKIFLILVKIGAIEECELIDTACVRLQHWIHGLEFLSKIIRSFTEYCHFFDLK